MAERRMFAKTIVLSDAFLDLPHSARCLYFTLGMFGDDDGFVNNPKSIMRQIDASSEDLEMLLANKFLIAFESGVIVIKHWRINNYLRNDRYQETKYKDEKSQLSLDENGAYTYPCNRDGIPAVYQTDTNGIPSIGKDSIEKKKEYKEKNGTETGQCPVVGGQAASAPSTAKRFVKPSVEDIKAYCAEAAIRIDAQRFWDFYESKGWKVGSSPMKDWKAAVRNWARRDTPGGTTKPSSKSNPSLPFETTIK